MRLIGNEPERQSQLLLLDLLHVCRMIMEEELEDNSLVARLRSSRERGTNVADALAVAFYRDHRPPEFYKLERVRDKLVSLFDSAETAKFAIELGRLWI